MNSELEDLRNVPQSAREDLEATHPSILYLLQEATKLATPAIKPFLDAEGLHDVPNEKIIHQSPASQEQNGPGVRNGFTGAFSVLSSSPWEVMSLINLQCERLLNSGDTNDDEEEEGSNLEQNLNVESEERKEAPAQEEMAICSTVEMDSVRLSFPHTIDSEHFVNQAGSEDGTKMNADENDLAELISENAEDVLHSTVLITEENLVEMSLLPLDLSKKADGDQTRFHPSEQEAEMSNKPLQSAEISTVDFSSSLVETDLDSSMCFAFDDENADSESTPHPMKPSQSSTDINNNNTEDEKLQDVEEARSRWGTRRRTPRKQSHPERSPDLRDPELQGVTFSMHTELDHGTDQCHLLITSNYSELCRRGRRGRGSRSRLLQGSQRTSSSEEESDSASMTKKICASCCTRKTPLWRDAEDGTPLCNACGIRYKKYRVRCLQCWNIPRKEASSNSKCLRCGDLLRLAAQNKRSSW